MERVRRPSPQTIAVMSALVENPSAWNYGYDLCQQTGLKAGTMYPILMRLADRGLLETTWETETPPGRPPRHMYRLTGAGRAFLAAIEAEARRRARRPSLHPRMEGAS